MEQCICRHFLFTTLSQPLFLGLQYFLVNNNNKTGYQRLHICPSVFHLWQFCLFGRAHVHQYLSNPSIETTRSKNCRQNRLGWFWWTRTILYMIGWWWFTRALIKNSWSRQAVDVIIVTTGKCEIGRFGLWVFVRRYFIHGLMGLDYEYRPTGSQLFLDGIFFAGMWISALVAITVLVIWLKSRVS